MAESGNLWRPEALSGAGMPETLLEPMEFLSRSWSVSALEVTKALAQNPKLPSPLPPSHTGAGVRSIPEDGRGECDDAIVVPGNPFSFASSATSQLVMERIMSQSQEVSPRTSGRLSHSSGPLNGGSLTDSPNSSGHSPSELDDLKVNPAKTQYRANGGAGACVVAGGAGGGGGGKTVGRWLKDRREKKKEEARAHNAQLHAAVSVAGVAAAVAAIAAATAAAPGKDEQSSKTDMAVASAATLVAAQCVEAAEALGAEREHLTAVVGSAVNVRSAGDMLTLTAAAATALRGAATLKARVLKEVWNIAAVIPVEKGMVGQQGSGSFSGELAGMGGLPEENFLGFSSQGLLAKGTELLKRTRKGDLHWKVVSVYINRMGQVMLKMKSRHVAGTITKKKKNVVLGVLKNIPAWPGRHLLEGGEEFRYFALRTTMRGVIEFECRNQREYDIWTQGVSRLLSVVEARKR